MSSKIHQRMRTNRAAELVEDYVEAIADMIAERGVCRSVDLVNVFSVTAATVSNTIGRLQRDGLVQTAPYQPIELTVSGKRLATHSKERHEIVKSFLIRIGVSEHAAAVDSEGIEHHVSKETLQAMQRILLHGWPT